MKVHIKWWTSDLFVGSSILSVNFQATLRFDVTRVSRGGISLPEISFVVILVHKNFLGWLGRSNDGLRQILTVLLVSDLVFVSLSVVGQNRSCVTSFIGGSEFVAVVEMIEHLVLAILNKRQRALNRVFIINSLMVLLDRIWRNIGFHPMEWGALRLLHFFFLGDLRGLLNLFHTYNVCADISPGIKFLYVTRFTILICAVSLYWSAQLGHLDRGAFLWYVESRSNSLTLPILVLATRLNPFILVSPFLGLFKNEWEFLTLQVLIANLVFHGLPIGREGVDHLPPFPAVSALIGQDSSSKNLLRWPNIITNWNDIEVDAFALQTGLLPQQPEISRSSTLEEESWELAGIISSWYDLGWANFIYVRTPREAILYLLGVVQVFLLYGLSVSWNNVSQNILRGS